jgi:hypothetical protein
MVYRVKPKKCSDILHIYYNTPSGGVGAISICREWRSILDMMYIYVFQANYINALAVSVLPFFEPAMPMTLGGLFVTLGGFWYDIG